MSQDQRPQPGPEHHAMRPFEGRFKARVTLYFGEQSIESTGVMENAFDLDGFYLRQHYEGDPTPGGPPDAVFRGRGFWGFNTQAGCYEGFWIDNASTAMGMETGQIEPDGRTWIMQADAVHPQSGAKLHKRSVITLEDNDRHRMETFLQPEGGDEIKHITIEYERIA